MNKHGLNRNIPYDVKRKIRQNCGFGCVICGLNIYEYEHIDPPFSEAKEHNPEKIALLCPQCHSKVTRGFMSKDSVKKALLRPICKERGFSNEFFDFGYNHPEIVFSGVTLKNCIIPVQVKGASLIEIKSPEQKSSPFLLSANFYNSRGEENLVIEDNEWKVAQWNWDVESTGGAIIIKDRPKHTALRIKANPPTGITIEKIDMYLKGYYFFGNDKEVTVTFPNGGQINLCNCVIDSCNVGVSFD